MRNQLTVVIKKKEHLRPTIVFGHNSDVPEPAIEEENAESDLCKINTWREEIVSPSCRTHTRISKVCASCKRRDRFGKLCFELGA